MLRNTAILTLMLIFVVACSSDKSIEQTLKKNPEIITKLIEDNPTLFIESFQKAARAAQTEMAKKREANEKQKLEDSFENPLIPNIRSDEAIRGNPNAPITIIGYSDFQCPFCAKGTDTVDALMSKYKGKVRFLYRHLPLDFHPQAMISAQYFEAIRLQSSEKAFKFHDLIFKDQSGLRKGAAFLDELAKKSGADLTLLKKNLKNEKIMSRINEDLTEAKKFGMQGTPGFIINGVPVRGAYPPEYFVSIIEELVKRKKLTL